VTWVKFWNSARTLGRSARESRVPKKIQAIIPARNHQRIANSKYKRTKNGGLACVVVNCWVLNWRPETEGRSGEGRRAFKTSKNGPYGSWVCGFGRKRMRIRNTRAPAPAATATSSSRQCQCHQPPATATATSLHQQPAARSPEPEAGGAACRAWGWGWGWGPSPGLPAFRLPAAGRPPAVPCCAL
jgi:hypothetical protein